MTTQANRQGRPWQRKDGRWAARAYPPDGSKPRMVYGTTEDEVLARQADLELATPVASLPPENPLHDERDLPPRPPKPIRVTVDLSQAEHLALRRYATEHGTSGAQVIRGLLAQLRQEQ